MTENASLSNDVEKEPSNPRHIIALTALILSAIAMAASVIFVRLADVGPFASAFYRVALALPLMAFICLLSRQSLIPWGNGAKHTYPPIILSGFFFAGDLFFWHLSILNTTVANATFFATLAPVVVLFLSWRILGEAVSQNAWAGLILCIIGGFFLAGSSYRYDPQNLTGDAYGLITAIFFGCYTLSLRKIRRDVGAFTLAFSSTLVTSIFLGIVLLITGDDAIPKSSEGWAVLFSLAFVSQIGGQALFAFAIGILPAAFSSLVIFLEGISAAIMGWVFLDEDLTILQIIGASILVFGIWTAGQRKIFVTSRHQQK